MIPLGPKHPKAEVDSEELNSAPFFVLILYDFGSPQGLIALTITLSTITGAGARSRMPYFAQESAGLERRQLAVGMILSQLYANFTWSLPKWGLVKILVPFCIPIIIRPSYLGYPKRDHNFDNPPHEFCG